MIDIFLTIVLLIVIRYGYLILLKELDFNRQLWEYGRRFENVYIVSRHPENDNPPFLPAFEGIVISVPYKEVYATKKKVEELLRLSNNQFFLAKVKGAGRLRVYPLLFKEGEHVNETFTGFAYRVQKFIEEDRAKKHKVLKNASLDWYSDFVTKQV